jgi:hypothetical protein
MNFQMTEKDEMTMKYEIQTKIQLYTGKERG